MERVKQIFPQLAQNGFPPPLLFFFKKNSWGERNREFHVTHFLNQVLAIVTGMENMETV